MKNPKYSTHFDKFSNTSEIPLEIKLHRMKIYPTNCCPNTPDLCNYTRSGNTAWVGADAKTARSYFLRPISFSIIMQLSDLWWQYRSENWKKNYPAVVAWCGLISLLSVSVVRIPLVDIIMDTMNQHQHMKSQDHLATMAQIINSILDQFISLFLCSDLSIIN